MMTASEPVVVTISHRLGRDEAKRRIDHGLGAIHAEVAGLVQSLDYHWEGDRLVFKAAALFQTITGALEVFDDHVRIEINLPRLLHLLGKTIAARIERRGQALLEGPKG